jgi:hypothetical protein
MIEYTKPEYSKEIVRAAGRRLGQDLIWDEGSADEIRQLFRVANNWRDAHLYPMTRMRHQLIGSIKRSKVAGVKTAARLKRTISIRKKLAKRKLNLDRIQDLGGCRAIFPTMDGLDRSFELLRERLPHRLIKEPDNYILHIKEDGYRSLHCVYEFVPDAEDEAIYAGMLIELQIRTRLQHSWATAVEAVGLILGQDYKGGGGDPDWRLLFRLMAEEFALAEGCGFNDGVRFRRREVKSLAAKLKAVEFLQYVNATVQFMTSWTRDNKDDEYFLIEFNREDSTVAVRPYRNPMMVTRDYDEIEIRSVISGKDNIDAVLVEARRIEKLNEVYPNYFGDVAHFRDSLIRIAKGKDAKPYVLPPQPLAAPKPRPIPIDPRWLSRYYRR